MGSLALRHRAPLLVGVVLTSAAACLSVSFKNGEVLCSDDPGRACPSGYACVAAHCWNIPPDLGSDGGDAGDLATDLAADSGLALDAAAHDAAAITD